MLIIFSGPVEGRRHDCAILTKSGLLGQLNNLQPQMDLVVYADKGYARSAHIVVPFKGANISRDQQAFNIAMSTVREAVEWSFKVRTRCCVARCLCEPLHTGRRSARTLLLSTFPKTKKSCARRSPALTSLHACSAIAAHAFTLTRSHSTSIVSRLS